MTESLSKRVQAVLENKGAQTKYCFPGNIQRSEGWLKTFSQHVQYITLMTVYQLQEVLFFPIPLSFSFVRFPPKVRLYVCP